MNGVANPSSRKALAAVGATNHLTIAKFCGRGRKPLAELPVMVG